MQVFCEGPQEGQTAGHRYRDMDHMVNVVMRGDGLDDRHMTVLAALINGEEPSAGFDQQLAFDFPFATGGPAF